MALIGRAVGGGEEQEASKHLAAADLPVRITQLPVGDDRLGEGRRVIHDMGRPHVEEVERVEPAAGATLDGIEHGKGVEPQDRLSQRAPPPGGDGAILALGVDDDGRARPGQQVRDDDADALAGAGRRDRQERAVAAEEDRLARLCRRGGAAGEADGTTRRVDLIAEKEGGMHYVLPHRQAAIGQAVMG